MRSGSTAPPPRTRWCCGRSSSACRRAGTRSGHGARVRADAGDPRPARASRTPSSGATAALRRSRKGAALAGRAARQLARWARPRGFDLALAHGSVDLAVVSTAACASPRCRCRTTSTPACSARSPSGPRAGCSCPTRSRSSGCGRPAPSRAQAGPLPGAQGGLLPGRLRARPGRCSSELGLDRENGRWSSSARRPRPPGYHAAQRPLRRGTRPASRRRGRRRRW